MTFWLSKEEDTPNNIKQSWIIEGFKECLDGFYIIQNEQFYISNRFIEMLGYDLADQNLSSEEWWENIIHPDDRERTLSYINDRRLGKNKKKQIEYRLRHRAGHYISFLATTYVDASVNGIKPFMAVFMNINSYRVLQDQLERTIEEAENTSQTKSKFIASLNHELRAPLNGIMGMANLLNETILDDQQKSYVNMILSSTQMLLTLVNDVLDVSKIASGKLELERVDFNLFEVLTNIQNILNPLATAKNLTLYYNIEENVPKFLVGDQIRLQQILINLINNAIKFTDSGEINVTVKKHQSNADNVSLLFRVTDTGIGISPEFIPNLFQDFTQASPSMVRTHGGTGLGLSICKKLVTLMGGDIGVQSTVGQGSTFWFTAPFPVVESLRGTEDNVHQDDYIPKLNILIAEDNIINQQVIEGILKNIGQTVVLASNGTDAIEQFEKQKFDLIFMDINMPGIDGFAATKLLREKETGANIPIIAFSADTLTTSLEEFRSLGFTDVTSKPVNKNEIINLIRKYAPTELLSQSTREEMYAIDHRYISNLLNDIGTETVNNLLNTYKTEAADIITKIEQEENIEECHKLAHNLAGISENLGIKEVGQLARSIMIVTKTENRLPTDLIDELHDKFTVALVNIGKMLEKL